MSRPRSPFEAGAVEQCPWHEEIVVDQCDEDALRHAYAIGTNRWKAGKIDGTREELMAAIKRVVRESAEECPFCGEC